MSGSPARTSLGSGLKIQAVVHCNGDLLFRPKIPLGCLYRRVPEQGLNLFKITTALSAEFGTGTPEVMRPEGGNTTFIGVTGAKPMSWYGTCGSF